jgi:8-oxo-dGTP pyrophosphatase MutT (NUDIX family)
MASSREVPAEFAVILLVLERGGADHVILAKRPERASDPYSGQVCLPGGAREPGDASLAACALREAEEELGIPPARVEIIAELDWHQTSLHHRIKPFAGRVAGSSPLSPNPDEVERVLYLPLRRLRLELFQPRGVWRDRRGVEHVLHGFELDGLVVWGLTARVLHTFFFESAAGIQLREAAER